MKFDYMRLLKLKIKKEPNIVFVEVQEEITDEIERSLWEMKEAYDIPTEEVETSVMSLKKNKDPRRQ